MAAKRLENYFVLSAKYKSLETCREDEISYEASQCIYELIKIQEELIKNFPKQCDVNVS